jgi:hypothetical protein
MQQQRCSMHSPLSITISPSKRPSQVIAATPVCAVFPGRGKFSACRVARQADRQTNRQASKAGRPETRRDGRYDTKSNYCRFQQTKKPQGSTGTSNVITTHIHSLTQTLPVHIKKIHARAPIRARFQRLEQIRKGKKMTTVKRKDGPSKRMIRKKYESKFPRVSSHLDLNLNLKSECLPHRVSPALQDPRPALIHPDSGSFHMKPPPPPSPRPLEIRHGRGGMVIFLSPSWPSRPQFEARPDPKAAL